MYHPCAWELCAIGEAGLGNCCWASLTQVTLLGWYMGLLEWCRLPRQYVTLGIVNGIILVMIEYNIFETMFHMARIKHAAQVRSSTALQIKYEGLSKPKGNLLSMQ